MDDIKRDTEDGDMPLYAAGGSDKVEDPTEIGLVDESQGWLEKTWMRDRKRLRSRSQSKRQKTIEGR